MPKRYEVTTGPATSTGTCRVEFHLAQQDRTDLCPDNPQPVEALDAMCQKLKAGNPSHPANPALWTCKELEKVLGHPLKGS